MNYFHSFTALIITSFSLTSWGDVDHGIGINLLRDTQEFDLNGMPLTLSTHIPKLQYQLSSGPWTLNLSKGEGESHASDTTLSSTIRYQLISEQEIQSIYLDYNFQQSWISLGYSEQKDSQGYQTIEDNIRSFNSNEMKQASWIIGWVYAWYFNDSQITLSIGSQYQNTDEVYQLLAIQLNSTNYVESDDVSHSGWLGNVDLNYQEYISISSDVHWMLGLGGSYNRSLNGETHIQQTSRVRFAGSNISTSNDDFFLNSESSSTNIILQTGLMTDSASFNLSVDNVINENWRKAYIELGSTLYF